MIEVYKPQTPLAIHCQIIKICYDLNPSFTKNIFVLKETNYNLRHSEGLLDVPRPNTTKFGKFFMEQASYWHKISQIFKSVQIIDFKI